MKKAASEGPNARKTAECRSGTEIPPPPEGYAFELTQPKFDQLCLLLIDSYGDDDDEAILGYYAKALQAKGWQIREETHAEDSVVGRLLASKDATLIEVFIGIQLEQGSFTEADLSVSLRQCPPLDQQRCNYE